MLLQLSQCCESSPNGEIDYIDDLDFGHCSKCGEWSFFEEFENDDESVQGKLELDDDEEEKVIVSKTEKPPFTLRRRNHRSLMCLQKLLLQQIH